MASCVPNTQETKKLEVNEWRSSYIEAKVEENEVVLNDGVLFQYKDNDSEDKSSDHHCLVVKVGSTAILTSLDMKTLEKFPKQLLIFPAVEI